MYRKQLLIILYTVPLLCQTESRQYFKSRYFLLLQPENCFSRSRFSLFADLREQQQHPCLHPFLLLPVSEVGTSFPGSTSAVAACSSCRLASWDFHSWLIRWVGAGRLGHAEKIMHPLVRLSWYSCCLGANILYRTSSSIRGTYRRFHSFRASESVDRRFWTA